MAPKRKQRSVAKGEAVEKTTAKVRADITSAEPIRTKRVSARAKKTVTYAEAEGEDETKGPVEDGDTSPSPKKKKRRTKAVEPVVYNILPVEHKAITFKGRLGYACLNTILRANKPEPIFCSRTCRIATILKEGLDFAKELGRKNCVDLCKLIQWNEENNIKFLRMSSEMFPFASHATYGYTLDYAAEELKAAGDLAKRYGHRLTTHPGQFTQLASPKVDVVTASIRELDYHCQIMRLMGLDQDSVIIIHMGGVYGDKETTLARFKENYSTRLTDEMKARLVLENDEICYSADDLLPVCNELDIPIVFDYHHNWINPSVHPISELITLINRTWERKGIKPKQHLSEPRPGAVTVMEKRAHADRCASLPADLPVDMDLMIEAKDKEQAVFQLYRVYDLHPVIHDNLRPEKPPKPFERADAGDLDKDVDGEEEAHEDSVSPRTRRARARTKSDNGETNASADVQTGQDASLAPTAPKKSKGRMKSKPGQDEASEMPTTLTPHASPSVKKTKRKYEKRSKNQAEGGLELLNQEEIVIPVDGAPVGVVESEEHPEATAVPEEACGVDAVDVHAKKSRKGKGGRRMKSLV